MDKKLQILNAEQVQMKLNRIAYEIVENNLEYKEITLAGIRENGVVLANILKGHIEKISSIRVNVIVININKKTPVECNIEGNFNPEDKKIILVDDVADSGKTMMYALRPFLHTICKGVQVAVLVDRKHKQFPITPDYIGMQLSTTVQENIRVECKNNKIEGAYIN